MLPHCKPFFVSKATNHFIETESCLDQPTVINLSTANAVLQEHTKNTFILTV